jgi:hypothetical protein
MIRTALKALCALTFAAVPLACTAIVGVEDFTLESAADDPCTMVHGCLRSDAGDFTGIQMNEVYVGFDEEGYNPRCIRIRSGMKVIFNSLSTFADYPIAGGIYPDVDPTSPIKNPANLSDNEASITLSGDCVFPYFSPPKGDTMNGAVFVGGL